MKKRILLGLIGVVATLGLASCGGGGGGTGIPTGGITTLRIQVVGQNLAGGLDGIAGATVYAVIGTGAGATVVPFSSNALDATKYDLPNPPANMTGFFVVPPGTNAWHNIGQYPALLFNSSSNNYQMPPVTPYDATIFAVPPVTTPFPKGIVDLGQIKLYAYSDPPPQPNFP